MGLIPASIRSIFNKWRAGFVPSNYTPVDGTISGHLEGIDAELTGGGGGGADPSDAPPENLGTTAAGTSADYSRGDHVHAMPSAADVGADATGTASSAVAAHVAAGDPHTQYHTDARADTWLGTKDSDDLAEGSVNLFLTSAERTAIAGIPVLVDRQSISIPAYAGETVEGDITFIAPFAGTIAVYRHYEGDAPTAGTALVTVTNRTGSVVMVNAQDAVTGITQSPTSLTMAATSVAAGDAIAVSVVFSAAFLPDEDTDGSPQSQLVISAACTES